MKSVSLLLRHTPSWVEIKQQHRDRIEIVASPPMPGSGAVRSFPLELRPSDQNGVSVTEQNGSCQLPTFCLERHLNPNSTFCLYDGSENELAGDNAALSWWSGLRAFLNNQVYAERHGVWPLAAGLSHGSAAREQLAMENLAEPLGWKEEVLLAMFRRKGWLANRLPRISKARDRVINARSGCPRGCTLKHKMLRRKSCELQTCVPDCRKQHNRILLVDCPNRSVVEALVLHEHKRREIESHIVRELAEEGRKCCRTMRLCPLRDLEQARN